MAVVTNNDGVIRALIAVGLSIALEVAAIRAPLVHAHLDDHATDHHGGRTMHAHLAGHLAPSVPADRPRVADDDHERAVSLPLFVAVSAPSFDLPATVASSFRLAVLPETPAHRSVQVVHGHDPPAVGSRPSRAPPTFLS